MMMPANFSAIAENEMTYVIGGSALTDGIKRVSTNAVTMVGNTYVGALVNATLGTMFSGVWGSEGGFSLTGDKGTFSHLFNYGLKGTTEMNGFNKLMGVIGVGAAIYNLGTAETVNATDRLFDEDFVDDSKFFEAPKKIQNKIYSLLNEFAH